jgi:hypothetical protein
MLHTIKFQAVAPLPNPKERSRNQVLILPTIPGGGAPSQPQGAQQIRSHNLNRPRSALPRGRHLGTSPFEARGVTGSVKLLFGILAQARLNHVELRVV